MEDRTRKVEENNVKQGPQFDCLKPLLQNPTIFYLDVSKFILKVGEQVKISKGIVFRAISLAQRFYRKHSHKLYSFPTICQAALVISLRTEGAEGTLKIRELYQNFGTDGHRILINSEELIRHTLHPHHIVVDDFDAIISNLCGTFSSNFQKSVYRIVEYYLKETTYSIDHSAKILINHAISVVKLEELMNGNTVKTLTVSTQTSPTRNPQEQIKKKHCQFCTKSFTTIQNKNRHEKSVHLNRENRCSKCNYKFKNLKRLQKHMIEKHDVIIQCNE